MRMLFITLVPGFHWQGPLYLVKAQVLEVVVYHVELLLLLQVVPLVPVGIFNERGLSGSVRFSWS